MSNLQNNSSLANLLKLNNTVEEKSIPKFRVKKLPKSIMDISSQEENIISNEEIIIPQSIADIGSQQILQEVIDNNKINSLKSSGVLRKKNVNVEVFPKENIQQIYVNKQKLQEYQEITNQQIPEGTDIVEVIEEIQAAAEEIPGVEDLSIDDFVITPKETGKGWFKNKVVIKSELASEELSTIASIVKKSTDNIVLHRAMDFRTIGNANKNQLKNSDFKLYAISYVFRPGSGKVLKAAKYARIAISVPADFNESKRILIFIQEKTNKYITEINCDIEFIAKVIADFYIVGFDVTKARLNSNGIDNPLNVFINKLTLSREYLVKPIQQEDGTITDIFIKTKKGKHQWLSVKVSKNNIGNSYVLKCLSKPDPHWSFGLNLIGVDIITIDILMDDKFFKQLNNLFNTYDWSKHGMGEDDLENRQFYLMNKITYKPLKNAFVELYELQSDNVELGVFVKEVLSQKDTVEDIDNKYKAEIIIGKTNYIDYFVLAWSAVKVANGDKRNYDSRPFMFTLNYSIGGKTSSINGETFDELKELTGFLTSNPK